MECWCWKDTLTT